jgi:hypothetical protein
MQTVTFIDPAGNVAQYEVYDANSRGEYHWSTDHGDSGSEMSGAQARTSARMALKASMAARGRTDQTSRYRSVEKRLQRPARKPMQLTVKSVEAPTPEAPLKHTLSDSDKVRWRLGRFASSDQGPPDGSSLK